jgi:Tfp pilus assembly protein PilW
MSLIEIMIALAILSMVMLAIYLLIFRSGRAYTDGSKIGTIVENGRRALDQIANEIRMGGGGTYANVILRSDYNTSDGVDFNPITSATSSGPTFDTTTTRFRLLSSPVDANANGSTADDYRLVRQRVTAGTVGSQSVLCDYVKPNGLTFTQSGNKIGITLTLHVADDTNTVLERAVTTSILLRNK